MRACADGKRPAAACAGWPGWHATHRGCLLLCAVRCRLVLQEEGMVKLRESIRSSLVSALQPLADYMAKFEK
jgi:hypothetical protein